MLTDTQPIPEIARAPTGQHQVARCPSCGKFTRFTKAGVQRCPPEVARAAGLPERIQLYHCETCESTISELDMTA